MFEAHRALVVQSSRFGTMVEDSSNRSMWRAAWILFFSLLIHCAQPQGKKSAESLRCRLSITLAHRRLYLPAMLTVNVEPFPVWRHRIFEVFTVLHVTHNFSH